MTLAYGSTGPPSALDYAEAELATLRDRVDRAGMVVHEADLLVANVHSAIARMERGEQGEWAVQSMVKVARLAMAQQDWRNAIRALHLVGIDAGRFRERIDVTRSDSDWAQLAERAGVTVDELKQAAQDLATIVDVGPKGA